MKGIILVLLVVLLLACSAQNFAGTVIEKHIVSDSGILRSTDYLVIVETDHSGKVLVDSRDAYYTLAIGDRVVVYFDTYWREWRMREGRSP